MRRHSPRKIGSQRKTWRNDLLRTLLLAGTSLLALSASVPGAEAAPITFGYTGKIVDYTVPTTAFYQIVGIGAQGGTESYTLYSDAIGGFGARVGGDFVLTAGEVLQIAVGGRGGNGPGAFQYGAGGGGGGTFVVGPGNTPLLIAGGGGGGGTSSGYNGVSATSMAATSGNGSGGGAGGSKGLGGYGGVVGNSEPSSGGGGGGGGLKSSGGNGGLHKGESSAAQGGHSFTVGLDGGAGGGYSRGNGGKGGFGGGGGGSGGYAQRGGGGGGGGYSGGGGGGNSSSDGGGAGGSFNAGYNRTFSTANAGDGSLVITVLSGLGASAPVPEPASLALFGTGLAGLGLIRRRRRG